MEEIRKEYISRLAKEIKDKIADGTIYGEPIDMQNADEVIVAIYFMSKIEETSEVSY